MMTAYKTELGKAKRLIGQFRTRLENLHTANSIKAGEIKYLRNQLLTLRNHIDKILQTKSYTDEEERRCKNCGREMDIEDKVCESCGGSPEE